MGILVADLFDDAVEGDDFLNLREMQGFFKSHLVMKALHFA